ncbi:hypothetical protein [Neisseria elongata]|jgi:hypothetical protein|uniref:hypothetical protein n=1 Tax=Neisseria elongata TaxID=495 RepID=UPI000667636A|nr:hypothetical protein [Neisseria elongata]
MTKKIILAMPPVFGIEQAIIQNLEFHGFEVIPIIYREPKHRYPHLWAMIKKFIFFNILKDKNYRKEIRFDNVRHTFEKLLNDLEEPADYCLSLWPAHFPDSFMHLLRKKARFMVHYNWESVDFLKNDLDKLSFFDKNYFFDPTDIGRYPEYPLLPITSFYFDYKLQNIKNNGNLLFIGSYSPNRALDIHCFHQAAYDNKLKTDFRIFCSDIAVEVEELKGLEGIRCLKTTDNIPYPEYLDIVSQAGILVDFLNTKHYGLSLRTFEAIGYGKKLITTNPTIVEYDFYYPENIFVWNGSNHTELVKFLNIPYRPLPEKIRYKYSFENWLNCVFDNPPYEKIELPLIKDRPKS